jgi:DNA-binding transcriptional regulator YdaS (Cro superfamily)
MPYYQGMSSILSPIEQACQLLGSQSILAKLLKVSPPTVNQWVKAVRPIPAEACVLIEQATSAKVMRWDLRPNDWHRIWPELIGKDGAPEVPKGTASISQEATETVASEA